MPVQKVHLQAIFSSLENSTHLAEILFYPEVSAYGSRVATLRSRLERDGETVLETIPLLAVHRRSVPGPLDVRSFRVEIEPPKGQGWTGPIPLEFQAVCWSHGTDASIAYVPALGIEALAKDREDLDRVVPEQIRFALMRTKATASLRSLVWIQRTRGVTVESLALEAHLKTPKELARSQDDRAPRSVLLEVAADLTRTRHEPAFEMEYAVMLLAEWLSGNPPRSVLLVGPSGAGKTAAVCELVRQRHALSLAGTPFWSTSGARIVAGMTGFGMWQERCQALCREATATKAVIHLGNLMELMQVGKYVGNDQGVGEFLRPFIARGELLAIAECTPEQLTLLERDYPGMLDVLGRLEIREPGLREGRAILRRFAQARRKGGKGRIGTEGLETLDRLHRRYATYSAYPGRPLRFLDHLLRDTRPSQQIGPAEVTRAFSRETGLPQFLLDESARLDLDATRDWFEARVMGQPEAVDVVVGLLAAVKANLTRPGRPLASLLFIGPTGVGKTEMARALAEFLYQDRRRMTRIDMSEFADPMAVDRLIGVCGGSEGLLTSKVREQPFGVVLLDEFEKAHPQFFDLLLQVLGEGRLTDAGGRLADFRNAAIIMTSNLGTESMGRQLEGFAPGTASTSGTEQHFLRAVQRFLRPEMFNRIDRVVPFLPLDESVLGRIAGRELALLQQREGIRYRNVQAAFAPEVAEDMVRRAYDPRYGARPIKRAIDRHILGPLAAALNDAPADGPLQADVTAGEGGLKVALQSLRVSPAGERNDQAMADLASRCVEYRRAVVRVNQSHAVADLRNDLYWLDRLAKRIAARKRHAPREAESLRRLPLLQELSRRVEDRLGAANRLETEALLDRYAGKDLDPDLVRRELDREREQFQSLRLDLFALNYDDPDSVTLVTYGEQVPLVHTLADAYHALAAASGWQLTAYVLRVGDPPPRPGPELFSLGDRHSKDPALRKQANENSLVAELIRGADQSLPMPGGSFVGIALCLHGRMAYPRLEAEGGVHLFPGKGGPSRCLVHACQQRMVDYQPPARIDRKGSIAAQPARRVYDRLRRMIEDRQADLRRRWPGSDLRAEMAALVEASFEARIEAALGR